MHICGNTRRILEGIGKLGCDIVDLDSMVPIAEARQKMGPDQIVLGNLNPVAVLRNGSPAGVTAETAGCRPGRLAIHRRRRLRSAARHAAREPPRPVRLRAPPPAMKKAEPLAIGAGASR